MASYTVVSVSVLFIAVAMSGCQQTVDVASKLRGMGATVHTKEDLENFSDTTPVVKNRGGVEIRPANIAGVIFNPGTKLGKSEATLLNTANSLKLLEISYCDVGVDFFPTLQGQKIEFLFADKCSLSDADCESISTLASLKQFSMRDAELSSSGRKSLKSATFEINVSY